MTDRTLAYAGVGTAFVVDTDSSTAQLSETDDGQFVLHGIALGESDVTIGGSGTRKIWPAEALQAAAETLVGQELVRDHINTTRGRIGDVVHAEYVDGVGVVYEAQVASHYEDIANDIKSGMMEVSVRAYHAPEEELEVDDETGALIVEDVIFDNLSVVNEGASPSNTASPGPVTNMDEIDDTASIEASATIGTDQATATLERSVKTDAEAVANAAASLSMDTDDTPTEGEPVASDDDDVFETQEAAEERGSELGCNAEAHEVDMGEETVYVPCADAETYTEAKTSDSDEMSADSDDESLAESEMYTPSEGDMVQWRVRPDLMGEIVHAPEEENYVMVSVMESDDGEMSETGYTLTAGYEDIVPMVNVEEGASLSPSMTGEYDLQEGQWVLWYPDETESSQKQGKAVETDSDGDDKMLTIQPYTQDDEGVFSSSGETVEKLEADVAPWGNYPSASKIEENASDSRNADASESDDKEGSDTNDDGSADSTPADIDFSDKIENGLKNKVEDHNDEHGDTESKRVTLRKLKAVYRRGAGAYSDSHREGMTRQQWSYARVNAFLYLVRNGNPENDNYTQDNDLLPDGHKRATENSASSVANGIASALEAPIDRDIATNNDAEFTELMEDMGPDHDHAFEDESEAVSQSMKMDLDGETHEMEMDGETYYVPGADHDEYQSAVSEQSGYMDEDEEENSASEPSESESTDASTEEMDGASTVEVPKVALSTDTDSSEASLSDALDDTLRSTNTMTDIEYEPIGAEELSADADEPVIVERDELEELSSKAERADDVEDELSSLSERLDSQDEASEIVEQLGEDELELIDADEESVVVEAAKAEMFEDVTQLYAEELAEHSPFEAEELADRFSPIDLRDRLEAHDSAELSSNIEDVEPEPEAGSADDEELADSDDESEEVREQYATELEEMGWGDQAQKVRDGELEVTR